MPDNEIISIDEAIRHCYEVYLERDDMCKECREEHRQLAKWLEELKESRNLINRLQAENERLEKVSDIRLECLGRSRAKAKAEAYKDFCEKLHTEILEARESNFKAKDGRIANSKKYGIPIDVEDSFLMYCDGKIHALDGIDCFAYNLLKELVGDGSGKM